MGEKANITESVEIYASLMGQIKARLIAIETLLRPSFSRRLQGPIVGESIILQLRLIMETLAVACLAAHGDIEETKKSFLRRSYRPEEIFRELAKLHQDFFPVPIKITQISEKKNSFEKFSGEFIEKMA